MMPLVTTPLSSGEAEVETGFLPFEQRFEIDGFLETLPVLPMVGVHIIIVRVLTSKLLTLALVDKGGSRTESHGGILINCFCKWQ